MRTSSSQLVAWECICSAHPADVALLILLGLLVSANFYLQYALDLWVEAWRKKRARGDVIIVCYANGAVLGFERWEDAERVNQFR